MSDGPAEDTRSGGGARPASDPGPGGGSAGRSGRIAGGAVVGLAVGLYALLAEAVVETFVRGSSLRLVVLGIGAVYAAGTYLAWRRTRWSTRALASLLLLWALVGLALHRDGGVFVLGQAGPVLASLLTLGSVALAGAVLVRAAGLPAWLRGAAAALAAYAAIGFGVAAWQGVPYSALLGGSGLGPPRPFHWLQGPLLGALVVIPAAFLRELVRAGRELRGAAVRPWFARVAVLAAGGLLAASTLAGSGSEDGGSVISGHVPPGHEDRLIEGPGADGEAADAEVASDAADPGTAQGTPLEELAGAAGSAQPVAAAPSEPARDFEPVKDFTLPSARRDALVRLADLHRGKVVLVNWARSTCGWSRRQAPRLAELYAGWKDRGLEIVGVLDENGSDLSRLDDFLAIPGTDWPMGLADQGEFTREIFPLGSGSTPETYLISRRGEITYLGLYRDDEYWTKLESAVEEALAEPRPQSAPIRPREMPPAPSFELPTLGGDTVRLADFAGRPLVVHIFTQRSCDWANGILADLHGELGDRVAFLGMYPYEADEALRECVERHGTRYPVAIADRETQQAWTGGSKGWAVFFVTAEGRVFKRILRSLVDGIEEPVFGRYARLLAEGRVTAGGGPAGPRLASSR